jgi:hypothetical protein
MAQADPISTATGEGVSRGGSTKSTSLRSAHAEAAAAPAGNPTHPIEALHRHVTAFFGDTAQQIPSCSLNRKHLNKLFMDLQSDAVVLIRNAPEELRNHKNWKVS